MNIRHSAVLNLKIKKYNHENFLNIPHALCKHQHGEFLSRNRYVSMLVFFACKEPSLFHISSKKGNSLQPGSTRVIFPNCKVQFTYYFEPVFACFSFLYLCLYVSKSYIVFYLLVHW